MQETKRNNPYKGKNRLAHPLLNNGLFPEVCIIYRNLRLILKHKNIGLKAFLKELNVTEQFIHRLKTGQSFPGTLTVLFIVRYFKVPLHELFNPEFDAEKFFTPEVN